MTALTPSSPIARSRSPRSRSPRPRSPRPRWPILLLLPAFVPLAVFEYFPLVRTAVLSMQQTDLFGRPAGFIGLDNYAAMFADEDFWATVARTLVFTAGGVVAKIAVSLAVAVPLSRSVRGGWISRAIVLIPMAVSVAVAGAIFRTILQPGAGLADQLLAVLSLPSPGWITQPTMAMVSVITVDTWTDLGFTILLILAALSGMPRDVHEAASIDGATAMRRLRSITIPLISPTLLFLSVHHTIGGLRQFAAIQMVTKGGPGEATSVLVIDIWNRAFGAAGGNFGEASARALVLLLLVALVTAANFLLTSRKVHYS